jgi:hypothetical protein
MSDQKDGLNVLAAEPIVGLHPQSSRHSARVSQTFHPSYISHVITAAT